MNVFYNIDLRREILGEQDLLYFNFNIISQNKTIYFSKYFLAKALILISNNLESICCPFS